MLASHEVSMSSKVSTHQLITIKCAIQNRVLTVLNSLLDRVSS